MSATEPRVGWQEDGSYVPCPQCHWKPAPRDDEAPGRPIYVMPRRPGTATHHGSCPVVDLSPESKEQLRQHLDELDRARRRAWEGAHNYVIG